ncbi:MAG: DUF1289 domain-containing protein [Pseudomonadota bacterium]
MSDEVWKREEIESPCVKLCVIDKPSGLCLGCHRSLDEIAAWSGLSTDQRRSIMAELPARAANAKPVRRGGRRGRAT